MGCQDKQVLVVDDDEGTRVLLRQILHFSGYQVATAADGGDALRQLRDGVQPCLILLDLMMPRMDGWEFLALQHKDADLAGIPVVVLSGLNDDRIHARSLDCQGILRKPLSPSPVMRPHRATRLSFRSTASPVTTRARRLVGSRSKERTPPTLRRMPSCGRRWRRSCAAA